MSQSILTKLAAVRRKEQTVSVASGAALSTVYLIVALALGMCIDWLFELPLIVRAILLLFDLTAIGYLSWRYIIDPLIHAPDDESLALAVEREERNFEGRLISSVQLSREGAIPPGASKQLTAAMIREAERISDQSDFGRAVKTDLLAKAGGAAALALLVGIVCFTLTAPASVALIKRAVLMAVPVPRKTHVVPVSTNLTIAVGDDVTIEATASGIKPSAGHALLRYASGPSQEIALARDPSGADDYRAKIANVQENFTYTIYLNDGHGERYSVTAIPPPAVKSMICWQIYPAYTHLPPQQRLPGDLSSILRGSRLVLGINASTPLRNAGPSVEGGADQAVNRVHLQGVDTPDQLLVVNPPLSAAPDHQKYDAMSSPDGITLPDGTTGMSIMLVDSNGVESKNPAVYPIGLISKSNPVIKLLAPRDSELLALPTDTLTLRYSAHDDFALGGLSLRYTVNGDPKEYSTTIPLDHPGVTDQNGTYNFVIQSIQPNVTTTQPSLEGTVLECWLAAADTDNVSNQNHVPNIGTSDHFQLRIVSQEEIDAHLHDLSNGAVGQIGTITQEQVQASEDLAHHLVQQPTTAPTNP